MGLKKKQANLKKTQGNSKVASERGIQNFNGSKKDANDIQNESTKKHTKFHWEHKISMGANKTQNVSSKVYLSLKKFLLNR